MTKIKFFITTVCLVAVASALAACGGGSEQNKSAASADAAIMSVKEVRDGAAKYYETNGSSYAGIKAKDLADPARGITADGDTKVNVSTAVVTIAGADKDTLTLSSSQGGATCTVKFVKGVEGTPSCS